MKIIIVVTALLAICFLPIKLFAQTTGAKKTCNGNDLCCKKVKAKDSTVLACKLTSEKLRERKETVIKSLKSQILEKKELPNGYQYKFAGTDKMIDELAEFVKTERACCDFFIFNLSFTGEDAILEITGPKGAKEFIVSELDM